MELGRDMWIFGTVACLNNDMGIKYWLLPSRLFVYAQRKVERELEQIKKN